MTPNELLDRLEIIARELRRQADAILRMPWPPPPETDLREDASALLTSVAELLEQSCVDSDAHPIGNEDITPPGHLPEGLRRT